MYLESQLLELQHAIVLRALDDIKTPVLRLKYYREVRSSLEIYAPLYRMTADEMIQNAIASGYIEPFTEREVEIYGK